jgi:hypothetical protein
VGIDRRRRTALEQVLYLTETTDTGMTFHGTIRGRWLATPRDQVEQLIGLLLAGLTLTTRWGGGSSRGLGWSQVEVTQIALERLVGQAAAAAGCAHAQRCQQRHGQVDLDRQRMNRVGHCASSRSRPDEATNGAISIKSSSGVS